PLHSLAGVVSPRRVGPCFRRLPPSAEIASARFLSCQQGSVLPRLLLPRHLVGILTVNESQPAPTHMGAWTAAVVKDIPARTPSLLKGVGQDRQLVEGPVVVDGLGEVEDGGRSPGRIEDDRAEGVAEDVLKESKLVTGFVGVFCIPFHPGHL